MPMLASVPEASNAMPMSSCAGGAENKSSNAIAGFIKRVQLSACLGTPTRKLNEKQLKKYSRPNLRSRQSE
jgi:hypothetical protein